MSKIMELVRRVLVSESNEDLNLIQAEVTRMEAELFEVERERDELIARLRNDKNMHPDELDALLNAAADALEAMRYFKACPGIARKGC